MKKKISEIQCILTIVFTTALIVSNVVAAKQIQLPFNITMTGAVIAFPITYILSDLFSEVYGYRWSRITCYMAFACNIFMVLIFEIVIRTPAPTHWLNQDAFASVLGSVPRVLIASLTAFVVGDFANDRVFRLMKSKRVGMSGFSKRALVSSFVGEVVDSAIFIPLAFYGAMPFKTMFVMALTQVCIKVVYEILILPLTTKAVKIVIVHEKGESNNVENRDCVCCN